MKSSTVLTISGGTWLFFRVFPSLYKHNKTNNHFMITLLLLYHNNEVSLFILQLIHEIKCLIHQKHRQGKLFLYISCKFFFHSFKFDADRYIEIKCNKTYEWKSVKIILNQIIGFQFHCMPKYHELTMTFWM